MAKKIFVTESDIEAMCSELRSQLSGLKCYGSIDIKRTMKADDRTAILYFTPLAWIKMTALVARFTTEVQWHGIVRRVSNDVFEIDDIIVPPHEVTGATVTSEYKPYCEWLDGLDDDTFNAVRFHGHSHVNMGVSPSNTDNKYRLDLVTQLPSPGEDDDVYYIFFIINKNHEWSCEIYDFTNNAIYGTSDIYVACLAEDDIDDFIADARKVAVARTHMGGVSGTYSQGITGITSNLNSKTTDKKKKHTKKGQFDDDYFASVFGDGAHGDDPNSAFYARGY